MYYDYYTMMNDKCVHIGFYVNKLTIHNTYFNFTYDGWMLKMTKMTRAFKHLTRGCTDHGTSG